jgi:predicted nucleotidyltransferase
LSGLGFLVHVFVRREEQSDKSDIDILIEFEPEMENFDDYMGVNYSMVWDVVKNKIPELYDQIESVFDKYR